MLQVTTRQYAWIILAAFLFLSFATLALGGWLTSMGLGPWYDDLAVPEWQPPSWVFTPAWTTILSLLAVGTWLVVEKATPDALQVILPLYSAQLILNIAWSLFFFTLQSPMAALIDIVLLDIVVVGMVVLYIRVSTIAGVLIVPYAFWLFLATAINIWIVLNN